MKKLLTLLTLLLFISVIFNSCSDPQSPVVNDQSTQQKELNKKGSQVDPAVLAKMNQINQSLKAKGLNIAVEEIEFFTIGVGRPSARIHQQPFRWVPNDERREADGTNITYIVDQTFGNTASGLTNAQTEAAIDRALNTWDENKAMKKIDVVKRSDPGTDITIYDAFLGFGGFGDPFAADIVEAGWYPRAMFDSAGGPGGGSSILAFTITFIFTDTSGIPTDINGDNYMDTALKEVYYNDTWGDPASPDLTKNYPWGINVVLPGIDVETVALHENGHSFELGHFGPPPSAVMNPVYAGIRHTLLAADKAGLNIVWGSWPNP